MLRGCPGINFNEKLNSSRGSSLTMIVFHDIIIIYRWLVHNFIGGGGKGGERRGYKRTIARLHGKNKVDKDDIIYIDLFVKFLARIKYHLHLAYLLLNFWFRGINEFELT